MSKENPSYYAILTADVRYDNRLKPNEKLLFAEITALCNKNGKCWASNQYFANLFSVSKTSVSKWISNLVFNGYLKSILVYKEGTKQIDNRYLTLVNGGIEEKLNTPIEEKLKDNITSNNITSNNREGKPSRPRFVKPTIEEIFSYMLEKNKEKSFAKKESEKMWNYYESKGWLVGKSKMKNWKASATNWANRAEQEFSQKETKGFQKNRPTFNKNR